MNKNGHWKTRETLSFFSQGDMQISKKKHDKIQGKFKLRLDNDDK